MKKALFMVALIALSFALTACGGSSGSDDCPPPMKTLRGCVSGAPIAGAKVFAKLDCLREEYKKHEYKDKALLVGETNDDGCIIFDEDALAKLDRTKNVFLFSKGGKQFNCAINCDGSGCEPCGDSSSSCDECDDPSCAFKGELRAILAPDAKEVYLTLPNTIVHDMVVDKEVPFEKAQNLVRKLICCVMCIDALPDPLGNPCLDLVKYEYIAQALLLGMGSDEEGLACNTPEYREALEKTVCYIAYWNYRKLESFEDVKFEDVKQAMRPVLGPEYDQAITCLTEDDVLTDEVYTIGLKRGRVYPPAWCCPVKECCVMPYDRHCPRPFVFDVVSKANKCGDACDNKGKFVVAALPSCGKLKTRYGRIVKVGDEFEETQRFYYSLTPEEYKIVRGQKVTFTFNPVNGCYTDPLVVCINYLDRFDVSISSFKHHRKFKAPIGRAALPASQVYEVYGAEAQGGDVDLTKPTLLALKDGAAADAYFRITGELLEKLLSYDIVATGHLHAADTLVAKVTAPAGFEFAYIGNPTDAFKEIYMVDGDGNLSVTYKAKAEDEDVNATFNGSTLSMMQGGASAQLELRSRENGQEAKRVALRTSVFKDGECIGACEPAVEADPEEEENANGTLLYIVAAGAEGLPQSIAMEAMQPVKLSEDSDKSVLTTTVKLTVKSWNSLAGLPCYVADRDQEKWTAEIVNPVPPIIPPHVKTGFGESAGVGLNIKPKFNELTNMTPTPVKDALSLAFDKELFMLDSGSLIDGQNAVQIKFKYTPAEGEGAPLVTENALTIHPKADD
ncbi:hypothetical protein [Halodesulfovibrio sp.]|jgi:hypothetical protein|uniref:hypothetical protein n=1 Tax=Halodesulfovibrio sp. TaxID=1912772 RepID=UPI0025E181DF|nr:hypothetical protein [Halodesulfovibrio sp.]MCT4627865.1 hypothetical protein [Halodesulfovibrio sp.]